MNYFYLNTIGPEEVLRGLLSANAPTAVLHSLADLSPHDPDALKIALLRTLRTLCVTISDYTGPSLWGISREHREIMSEARSMLDYLFQVRFSCSLYAQEALTYVQSLNLLT